MNSSHYFITAFSFGSKYKEIEEHWEKRIREKCKNATPIIFRSVKQREFLEPIEAWWDIIRTKNILDLLMKERKPIVQCDLDIVIEKDIKPLIDLDYDFIISQEHYGNKAYPRECSEKLGFGICSGFYIVKPRGFPFLCKIYENMTTRKYCAYGDQVNLMNYIIQNEYTIKENSIEIDGIMYTNKIVKVDGFNICVLDFELVRRDPFERKKQIASHINVDSVGGIKQLVRYYYEPYEKLPISCGCSLKKNKQCYYHKENLLMTAAI